MSHATPPAASTRRLLLREVAEALFPQRCLVCDGFGSALHAACVQALPLADGVRCARCWRPGHGTWCERCAEGGPAAPAFDALRAPFRFTGDARRAVLEAKFRGVTALLPPLAEAAAALVPVEWRPDAVVPVPLSGRRERRRGFNQAAVIASAVAAPLGVTVRPGLVRRRRDTPAQASLTAARRATNLEGAFQVRGAAPERVLVVDDVTTTGSTLGEVARALKAAGAARVYALALARED